MIAASPEEAIANARAMAGAGGSVLVTGSFFTVGPILGRLSASD
jgi:folylpolyglutamate synthase/dihydropteroate synthase